MSQARLGKHEREPERDRAKAHRSEPVSGPDSVLGLQRLIGNEAVAGLLDETVVDETLGSAGKPLDGGVRADMEARFGADFSDVRVHNDETAKRSAAEIGARAYTAGSHVVFGDHGDDPHTLAHELKHVLQQRQGPVSGQVMGDGLKVSHPDDVFEREAEATADEVMRGPVPAVTEPVADEHPTSDRPIQRTIVDMSGGEGNEVEITTAAQVRARPEFQGLGQRQLDRVLAIAQSDDEYAELTDVLEQTRDTVVGAVDGSGGRREGDFLASAWRLRENVTAYDPEMQPNILRAMLDARQVPPGTSILNQSSITDFGAHVPNVHVLVPHPGPWITRAVPPNDLASCLDRVLGPGGEAYVLTDNEPAQGFATTLVQQINNINTAGANASSYRPMTLHGPQAVQQAQPGDRTNLGGATLELGHAAQYAIIRITRG
ncbi:DUF4157 domain-containing protein [Actinocrispum wychmicini]|uniref:Uncharacterized protein DUF4157 n=1 Tax=Actinocrispum wychmicini TaxID=1213861 RepID=A0A4R2JHB6_9PSEU|nr:DUF4157 domain-containing protein [Actinocrispum wychmicini]TCO55779.1 uncharacterized protein DUF4157 [Actinocrispum wychmicini]